MLLLAASHIETCFFLPSRSLQHFISHVVRCHLNAEYVSSVWSCCQYSSIGASAVGQAYCSPCRWGVGHKDGFILNVSFQQRARVISVTLLSALAPGGIRLFPDCLAVHFNFTLKTFCLVHNNNIHWCVVIFFQYFLLLWDGCQFCNTFALMFLKDHAVLCQLTGKESFWPPHEKKNALSHRLVVFHLIRAYKWTLGGKNCGSWHVINQLEMYLFTWSCAPQRHI